MIKRLSNTIVNIGQALCTISLGDCFFYVIAGNLCHISSPNLNIIASAAAVVGSPPSFTVDALAAFSLKSFALNDLKQASKNFNREYFLGEGEFGCVFKGWIDKNTFVPSRPGTGIGVAIKKLKPNSFQGHQEWLVCSSNISSFAISIDKFQFISFQ